MAGQFTVEHFVAQARLAYVLRAMAGLGFPGSFAATWSGDGEAGVFTNHDGCGNWWGLGWSADGLVGLVFDHESTRSEYARARAQRRPLQWLRELPASLGRLAEELAGRHERLATAGLWICGRRHRLSDRWDRPFAHGLERLRRYAMDAESALFAARPGQRWLELVSLSEAQGRLALRLARLAGQGAVEVRAEDEAILLGPPEEGHGPVTTAAAEAMARALAAVGVRWRPPLERLAAATEAREVAHAAAVREALGGPACELFAAVRAGDPARVRVLLAAGAPIDARTVADQWPYTPAGDTPLIQALKANARGVALVLIAAGADVAARNSFGQTALFWAATRGDAESVAALLARGAAVNVGANDGTSPLHAAVAAGPAIVTALLRAGADPQARAWNGMTPGDLARAQGRREIAQLLEG